MAIWGDEIRDRTEQEYRLRLDRHTKARERELVEARRLERLLKAMPSKYEPGVYEEEIHAPGEHWVTILLPSGAVGTVRFPDELWDDSVIPNLWKRFDAKTKRRLRAI